MQEYVKDDAFIEDTISDFNLLIDFLNNNGHALKKRDIQINGFGGNQYEICFVDSGSINRIDVDKDLLERINCIKRAKELKEIKEKHARMRTQVNNK